MNVEFKNPGIDYMIERILDFQTETESVFWSEPLYHFYPQLDKVYAASLSFAERESYIERTMRAVYMELEERNSRNHTFCLVSCVESAFWR